MVLCLAPCTVLTVPFPVHYLIGLVINVLACRSGVCEVPQHSILVSQEELRVLTGLSVGNFAVV